MKSVIHLIAALAVFHATAQDGTLDMAFDPGQGANNMIEAIAVQPDGKIIIGGQFSIYGGVERNHIARLNSDGTLDTSFDPGTGADNGIHTIAIQSDGKILIGGWFSFYDGAARNYIARLNGDGTLDTGFDPGAFMQGFGQVDAIAIQPDGRILIGGFFMMYDGITHYGIARLNPDGSMDTGFDPGMGAGFINAIAIQSDGKILIGGDFTEYDGTPRNHIARLHGNGSLDQSFLALPGADNGVYDVAVQADGSILIGGSFSTVNGTPRGGVARLHTNGSLDTGFDPGSGIAGTTGPSMSSVQQIQVLPGNRALITGYFTIYNSASSNHIACLGSDGGMDLGFHIGSGANSMIISTAVQPDGKILIGGMFATYDGTERNRIARVNNTPSVGLPEHDQGSLLVYPNPTTGPIAITLDEQIHAERISVLDASGRVVFRRTVASRPGNSALDLSRLDIGTYLVQLRTEDGRMFTRRVVKE